VTAVAEASLSATIRLIPGYDPYAHAGDCVFDEQAAARAVRFFPAMLQHIEGEVAGKPFDLEPWQQAIVANLFGWKRPDGTRRYREAFVYVPRKNGKTPLCAGIGLFLLLCDGEPGPQVFTAAADKAQAALVYRHAAGMVHRQPALKKRVRPYRSLKSLETFDQTGQFRSLSHEADTKHGLNIHGCVVDELHAHPDGDLVDALQTGMASRRQPLLIHITTADYYRESICNRKYEYACNVRDNGGDPTKPGYDFAFLPVIYEAPDDADWKDPETWRIANPNLGVSVKREYLERECRRAQEEPSFQAAFRRFHLNQRTNADVVWLDMTQWDECAGDHPYAELAESLVGEPCHGGLDLSKTTDLTSLALYFARSKTLLVWFWMPSETIEKAKDRDRVPYLTWADQGYLETTPGNVVDYTFVRQRIEQIAKTYQPTSIGFDPHNATHMIQQLMNAGVDMVEYRQGFLSMSPPTKELERLVVGGQVVHGGHPVLRWCASNVMVRLDPAGNIKPDKAKSTGRIDGITASVMAIGRSIDSGEDGPSVYEERDPIIV